MVPVPTTSFATTPAAYKLRTATSPTLGASKSKTPYADLLGQVTSEQQDYYDTTYRPVAQQLIADVNSTAIVDNAKKNAGKNVVGIGTARSARQKARLGVVGDPATARLGEYESSLNTTLSNDANINYSRQVQQERNDAVRSDLVSVSRGIAQDATSGMTSAAESETNRGITNANIKAQNSSAKTQLAGSLGSMALMALLL